MQAINLWIHFVEPLKSLSLLPKQPGLKATSGSTTAQISKPKISKISQKIEESYYNMALKGECWISLQHLKSLLLGQSVFALLGSIVVDPTHPMAQIITNSNPGLFFSRKWKISVSVTRQDDRDIVLAVIHSSQRYGGAVTDIQYPLEPTTLASVDHTAGIQMQAENVRIEPIPQIIIETVDNSLSTGHVTSASKSLPVESQGYSNIPETTSTPWTTGNSFGPEQTTLGASWQGQESRYEDHPGITTTRSLANPEDTLVNLVKWYRKPVTELIRLKEASIIVSIKTIHKGFLRSAVTSYSTFETNIQHHESPQIDLGKAAGVEEQVFAISYRKVSLRRDWKLKPRLTVDSDAYKG